MTAPRAGLLVTGGSGAVGTILLEAAAAAGVPGRGLARDPGTNGWLPDVERARREVGGDVMLVHAAIPPQPRTPEVMARYERESLLLVDRAQELGIPVTLISTLSIHPGNPSAYVAHKRQLEQQVLRRGGGVIRLGIVPTGLAFTRIRDLVRRAPAWLVTSPASVYFLTLVPQLAAWVTSGPVMPARRIIPCADPRPLGLREAVGLPGGSGGPGPGDPDPGTARPRRSHGRPATARLVPEVMGRYLDPVINLRAGMGWVDDER